MKTYQCKGTRDSLNNHNSTLHREESQKSWLRGTQPLFWSAAASHITDKSVIFKLGFIRKAIGADPTYYVT